MITLIGDAVSAATGVQGGFMTGPAFTLRNVEGNWSAANEAARTVLETVLADERLHAGGYRYGWVVGYLHAPETFGLNITVVPPAQSAQTPVLVAPPSPNADATGGAAVPQSTNR
jgi:hypothetical protein